MKDMKGKKICIFDEYLPHVHVIMADGRIRKHGYRQDPEKTSQLLIGDIED